MGRSCSSLTRPLRSLGAGISLHSCPSRTRPPDLLVRPPHCLKKKGTFSRLHCRWSERTHSASIRPVTRTRLSTGDEPIDACQVEIG